jgi:hypothetical protein
MHPIVVYVLVKTRMEHDRQAERRRLARSEMPGHREHPPAGGHREKMACSDSVAPVDRGVLARLPPAACGALSGHVFSGRSQASFRSRARRPACLAGPATASPGFRAAGGMESYMSVQEMAEDRGVTRIPPAGPVVGRLP